MTILTRTLFAFLFSVSALAASSELPKTYAVPTGPESLLHSHNDFAQKHPLATALENGYRSIEVDVTDRWGEIRVTHLGFFTDGTLKEMYLDQLQKLVDGKGSVYGDGKRFYLWIELRPFVTSDGILPMLRELLPKYSMFTRFSADGKEVLPGPVEAILINSPSILAKYFTGPNSKPACRGVHGIPDPDEEIPPYTRWAYVRWSSEFTWRGLGPMPEKEEKRLIFMQARAHAAGLRTRYWEAPEEEGFWKKAVTLPFDLVGTDRLASTMATIRQAGASGATLAGSHRLPERHARLPARRPASSSTESSGFSP